MPNNGRNYFRSKLGFLPILFFLASLLFLAAFDLFFPDMGRPFWPTYAKHYGLYGMLFLLLSWLVANQRNSWWQIAILFFGLSLALLLAQFVERTVGLMLVDSGFFPSFGFANNAMLGELYTRASILALTLSLVVGGTLRMMQKAR